jgi:hypothetical protein
MSASPLSASSLASLGPRASLASLAFVACALVACGNPAGPTPGSVDLAAAPDDSLAAASAEALTRNDVSVLFPLPTTPAASALLWSASLEGLGGPLLPKSEFARNTFSLTRELDDDLEYDALRVVAVRFDPCFKTSLGGPCQPQVRLVWQAPDPTDPPKGFLDGSVHSLYAVPDADLPALVAELRRLAPLAPENTALAPLGVSPALAARGLDSDYAHGLKALVLRHAGAGSLVRVTFMTRTFARSGQWQFAGFHVGPNSAKIEIAGLGGLTQQNVTREIAHGFEYVVHPKFIDPAAGQASSSSALTALDPAARADVHAWALRQEDPATHLPDTTDCASCHLANHVGRHLESLDPSLLTSEPVARRGPRTLSLAETDADNLRAFGYFGPYPQVSQRVANETEAVLAALR